jgi:ParB family chromosome partitioning protein
VTIPKQSIRHIAVADLVGHDRNIREDAGDLVDLARSIREHGILQPLIVTEHPKDADRWLILAGHRRKAGAQLAQLDTVPCVIRHNVDSDEQIVVMVVENCQRKDLGPMEKAEAFAVLRRRGLSMNEIARRTGISQGTVSYYLTLIDLDAATREAVRNGQVQITDAVEAVRTARRSVRTATGQRQPGHPVVREPAHFTVHHPLAQAVKDICGHTQRPSVGGIGCGQCWELVVRADASQTLRPRAAAS